MVDKCVGPTPSWEAIKLCAAVQGVMPRVQEADKSCLCIILKI